MKEIPLHLDSVDLSSNRITAIPDLGKHKLLRVLKLSANKISAIGGLSKNRNLRVLDLS
jgi:Leucine-rich repeat (LRR) protein